ncbi:MAG: hypothetical protein NTV80_07945 [Verrucomicrobia bacterium]|nr:hypothetical protein [Verrucomicrobiota bacterium]
MNPRISLLLFAALGVALPSFGQTSSIVGFERLPISGTGGTTSSKLSFTGMPLVPHAVSSGTASSVGTSSITSATSAWSDDQFNGTNGSHFVEILSIGGSTTAAGVGKTYEITDTSSAGTITLSAALASSTSAPLTFVIRPHWTISSVFGPTNSVGIEGGTAVSADLIQVWNGSGYDTYYYQTSGIGGTGWRSTADTTTDAGGTVIDPTKTLILKRGQSAAVSLIVTGAVKTGITSRAITAGVNFVPNPCAIDMTLTSSAIYTGNNSTGMAGGTATSADQILLWTGSGYETYYYQTSGIGGTGWRKAGAPSVDASAAVIGAGTCFSSKRSQVAGIHLYLHPITRRSGCECGYYQLGCRY